MYISKLCTTDLHYRPLRNGNDKNKKQTWNITFGKTIHQKKLMLH